jgi:hypothetical protein
MELICPDCRADLVIADPQNATCAGHDGRYQILFDRAAAPVGLPAGAAAANVASSGASVDAFDDPNIKTCAACDAPNPITAQKCGSCGSAFTLLQLTGRPAQRTENLTCAQHGDVPAVGRCRICRRGVCATCDFLLPGNLHVCPACLEKEPSTEISPKRRNLMIGAIIVAVYCTLMFAFLMTGTIHRAFGNNEFTNMLAGNAILIPAIIGTVMAFSTFDRRLSNSSGIWVAVVWNSINLGIFLLLMLIGLARG